MERKLEESLKNWKERATRHPLILRGARQVGKTYLVREFARKCFKREAGWKNLFGEGVCPQVLQAFHRGQL